MSEKQSSQNTWICQKFHLFTYLGATNITSKQKSDMTKVAIKNVNITSFGGIYHIMDVFSKLGFEKLTESYWANVKVAAKHSVMEVFLALSSSVTFVVENALRTSMRLLGSSSRDLIRCYPVPTLWGAD